MLPAVIPHGGRTQLFDFQWRVPLHSLPDVMRFCPLLYLDRCDDNRRVYSCAFDKVYRYKKRTPVQETGEVLFRSDLERIGFEIRESQHNRSARVDTTAAGRRGREGCAGAGRRPTSSTLVRAISRSRRPPNAGDRARTQECALYA
ncbi:hypothetical protein EVAR_13675_1 [Eumeta japonica]|uniref:Uncharacterized protein n=1 Tax=Eumeta variegata TaxID=151549 RepID=A0A4C1UC66_EUMVA|nr:hypothetical protein EVAR_13675_1 [Eumeta japonica]